MRNCGADFSPRGTSVPLPRAGPPMHPRGCHQARPHGVVLDVVHDSSKLVPIAHQPVVAFVLPERARSVECLIGVSSSSALELPKYLVKGSIRRHQQVHMVGHDHIRMQFGYKFVDVADHNLRDLRLRQEPRTGASLVQHPVHCDEGFSTCDGSGWEPSSLWRAFRQAPGHEHWLCLGVEVGQAAIVDLQPRLVANSGRTSQVRSGTEVPRGLKSAPHD